MSAIIEVGGNRYRPGRRLSAMEQFHVTRRLGPALVICGVTWQMMQDGVQVSLDDWVAVAGPVMEIVSKMSDADVEYVILTCLQALERESTGGHWSGLVAPDGKSMMFADIDQAAMIRLTLDVLRTNLANFAKGMSAEGSSSEGSGSAAHP